MRATKHLQKALPTFHTAHDGTKTYHFYFYPITVNFKLGVF